LTIETFIERARSVHGDKFDYSKADYKNSKTKVIVICQEHGEFLQIPNDHLVGKGCGNCGDKQTSLALSSNTQDFIEKDKLIHGGLDEYDRVKYINNHTEIEIYCKKCKEYYWQLPLNRINPKLKARCNKCRSEKMSIMFRDSKEDFVKKAVGVHGTIYQYDKVEYKNSNTKVLITCLLHGDFPQTPGSHLVGNGCPTCNHSRGEKAIRDYLTEKLINFEPQKTFKGCSYNRLLRFDFYLLDYNLAIEFDGEQHFKPVSSWGGEKAFALNQIKDNIKNSFCRKSEIPLLRIKYDEIDNIEELLDFSISFFQKSSKKV